MRLELWKRTSSLSSRYLDNCVFAERHLNSPLEDRDAGIIDFIPTSRWGHHNAPSAKWRETCRWPLKIFPGLAVHLLDALWILQLQAFGNSSFASPIRQMRFCKHLRILPFRYCTTIAYDRFFFEMSMCMAVNVNPSSSWEGEPLHINIELESKGLRHMRSGS